MKTYNLTTEHPCFWFQIGSSPRLYRLLSRLIMKLQPDRMDTLAVTGYGPGWIAVNGQRYHHSLLITSQGLLQPWRPTTFDGLEAADFAMLTLLGIELAVFGSGSRLRFIPPAWQATLMASRPEITQDMVNRFLEKMYGTADFVITATRDYVKSCNVPLLVLPDNTDAHPYTTAMEMVRTAPDPTPNACTASTAAFTSFGCVVRPR